VTDPAPTAPAGRLFSDIASGTARLLGKPATFMLSVALVLIWAACGPLFHFSEGWQLVINTGTTIVTFLMVFLIQNSQNREAAAAQAKLDELIRSSKARNEFIAVQRLSDDEIAALADAWHGRHMASSPLDTPKRKQRQAKATA
jgi:low affinity Fe/Cu permease